MTRPKVVFLCTGHSCRSQMAHGWAAALHGRWLDVCSAGTHPKGLDPRAVAAMREAGIDISGHPSRRVDSLLEQRFDLAVTVCDSAKEQCPLLPGAPRTIHQGFDDPPALAAGLEGEAAMAHYRRVRDEIRDFVRVLPQILRGP